MQQIIQEFLLLLTSNDAYSLSCIPIIKHTGWWRDSDSSVAASPVPPAAPVTVTTSLSLILAATSSPKEAVQKLMPREEIASKGICYFWVIYIVYIPLELESSAIRPQHILLKKLHLQKKYNKHDLPHAAENNYNTQLFPQIPQDLEKMAALISLGIFPDKQGDLLIIL